MVKERRKTNIEEKKRKKLKWIRAVTKDGAKEGLNIWKWEQKLLKHKNLDVVRSNYKLRGRNKERKSSTILEYVTNHSSCNMRSK